MCLILTTGQTNPVALVIPSPRKTAIALTKDHGRFKIGFAGKSSGKRKLNRTHHSTSLRRNSLTITSIKTLNTENTTSPGAASPLVRFQALLSTLGDAGRCVAEAKRIFFSITVESTSKLGDNSNQPETKESNRAMVKHDMTMGSTGAGSSRASASLIDTSSRPGCPGRCPAMSRSLLPLTGLTR